MYSIRIPSETKELIDQLYWTMRKPRGDVVAEAIHEKWEKEKEIEMPK